MLPELFEEYLLKIFESPSLIQNVKKTFVQRPTTFRVNTHFFDGNQTINELKSKGFKLEKHAMSNTAFILKNKSKKELMETPEYTESKIYLQSLASQAPVVVLKPKPNQIILDLTAAPGSKTSQIGVVRLYLIGRDRDVSEYTREDAKLFVRHLDMRGNKTTTIRRRINSLSAILNYAYAELDLDKRNPLSRLIIKAEG